MLVVIGLGGNATQQECVALVAESLATMADDHDLVITYGNGRRVGLLAPEGAGDVALLQNQSLAMPDSEAQGMTGYWLLEALENALPGREVVSLVCQTLVDDGDRAFEHPTRATRLPAELARCPRRIQMAARRGIP